MYIHFSCKFKVLFEVFFFVFFSKFRFPESKFVLPDFMVYLKLNKFSGFAYMAKFLLQFYKEKKFHVFLFACFSNKTPSRKGSALIERTCLHRSKFFPLTLKAPNKNCSRRHFNFLLLFFEENKA